MCAINEINIALNYLWSEYPDNEINGLAPMQYNNIQPNGLLFIGINPSFSAGGWARILQGYDMDFEAVQNFFAWPRPHNYTIERDHELESRAIERHPYFRPLRCIANQNNISWSHIDIFAYRETNQAVLRNMIFQAPNQEILHPFWEAQYQIFRKLLLYANPRLIIIVNALASRIFLNKEDYQFNNNLGLYTNENGDAPVLPSGMITGSRGLDVYSRQRLEWHVSRALQHNN